MIVFNPYGFPRCVDKPAEQQQQVLPDTVTERGHIKLLLGLDEVGPGGPGRAAFSLSVWT